MAAAALESWQAAAPRRKRGAERRPRRGEAEARGPQAALEADVGRVLRRLREAEEDLRISDFWSSALACSYRLLMLTSVVWKTFFWRDANIRLHSRRHTKGRSHQNQFEIISQCLRKQQEQLKAPAGALSDALESLHLDSPAGRSEESLVADTCHVKCVCYGIGSFASCVTARIQLAFLFLLLERYQIPRSHCCVYDPVLSQVEIAVLITLGVTVLGENEEGKRSVCGEPTIFYMPHCGTALYNNVLWSNWSADALCKMLIIGNSFRGLEERLLTRILQKSYPYIAKILGGLEELALPQTPQYMNIFNDTSIHWFPATKLEGLPGDLWAFPKEPEYLGFEDLEIIRKQAASDPDYLL